MSSIIQTCKVANYLPVKKLKHHPKNDELRTITEDRLADLKESIRKKGFYEPILVKKKGNLVLAGNQRLKAAKELIEDGWAFETPDGKLNELPVVILDVSEEMELQILTQANSHHGDWITAGLAKALKEAESMGVTATDLGFTEEFADKVLKEAVLEAEKEAAQAQADLSDDDDSEKLGKPTSAKPKFLIVVELTDEASQAELYQELTDRELNVKMMS